MHTKSERYARIAGVVSCVFGFVLALLTLFYAVDAVSVAHADGISVAAGPGFGALFIGGGAAICFWCGRLSLGQARAGMPLTRYRLGASAAREYVRPLTAEKCPAVGPFEPGWFLFSDPGRPDGNLTAFDIVHNEVHGIDGEGIQPIVGQCQHGRIFNHGRMNGVMVFLLP